MELRDAYFSTLHEKMKSDPSMFVIVGDFSAHWLERIATDFPQQYLNAGIAEANIISMAAGMAIQGRRVYVVGQCNFVTLRCIEQISIDLCMMKLPVTIVGCSPGYTMSIDGPTHHGITDLGMMMQLPCEIYNCSDEWITKYVAMHKATIPTYVRLPKGEHPNYGRPYSIDQGFSVLRGGEHWTVSSGIMVHEAMKGGNAVIDLYRPHPLNGIGLIDAIGESFVDVLEDNLFGPIHKAIAGAFALLDDPRSIAPQSYTFEYGTREFVQKKAGL